MSDVLDDPLDDLLTVDSSPTTQAPQPLILVEYRYRGIPASVVFALLVLTAALGIMSHRRVTPPRALSIHSGAPSLAAVAVKPPQEPVPASPPVEVASASEPLVAVSAPVDAPPEPETPLVPVPEPVVVAEARPQPLVDAPQTAATMALPPLPEPLQEPRPSAEEVERDIQREAAEREAELEAMSQLKPEARRLEQEEGPRRSREQRLAFRKELLKILKAEGNDAGPHIDALCDQYGRDLADDQRAAVTRRLRHTSDRTTRQDRIAVLRAFDVPEPAILDDLARYWDRRLRNARGGVRDHEEIRVKAAWQLLSFPLPPAPPDRPANP